MATRLLLILYWFYHNSDKSKREKHFTRFLLTTFNLVSKELSVNSRNACLVCVFFDPVFTMKNFWVKIFDSVFYATASYAGKCCNIGHIQKTKLKAKRLSHRWAGVLSLRAVYGFRSRARCCAYSKEIWFWTRSFASSESVWYFSIRLSASTLSPFFFRRAWSSVHPRM